MGWGELQDVVRGERWASVRSPLFLGGAFSGDEREEVLGGNRVFQDGNRYYVETWVILFEGFPKGAMLRAPLDQEFLPQVERRPCRARLGSARANMCWMTALSPGASLPRRGSMNVARPRLEPAWRRGALVLPLAGKFRRMRV